MRIIDNLYTYGIKDKKLKGIIKKIRSWNKSSRLNKLYVVTMPLGNDGLLEIYIYNQLLQPYYRNNYDVCVVGIATSKDSAMNIVTEIVQQSYDAGYDLDIRGFLGI